MAEATIDATGLMVLSFREADALDALTARIIPGDDADPGAREAGVVTYIDRALAGPYAEWRLAYREGLRLVDAFAEATYGKRLGQLAEDNQDEALAALQEDRVPGFAEGDGARFFDMIWAHTIEGMFSDPAYGGNRNAVGWRLIGFPGAQYGYSADEMRYGADLTAKPIMTLADIRRLARERPELFYQRPDTRPAPGRDETPAMPSAEATLESDQSQGG
ncbi:MAG TPA: gluconate 2-dehydrogenase subunit 3 family protein [Thermomicrobiales bacterium]|nr:gluconate 2-dehydrogenase subunit 3 family protein [Thermomicrobiales bacterium]